MPLESEPGDAISIASWGNLRLVRATLPVSGGDYPALAAQQDAPGDITSVRSTDIAAEEVVVSVVISAPPYSTYD